MPTNRAEFAQVMATLYAAAGKEPLDAQVEVYFRVLGHWPAEVLKAAALRALAGNRFIAVPPIGVLNDHCAAVARPAEPSLADAWAAVKSFAEEWYPWILDGLPTDPKTRARYDAALAALPAPARRAAEAYGWPEVATVEPGVAFAHFRQIYESAVGPDRVESALPPAARLPKPVAELVGGIGRMPALNGGVK